MDNKKVSMNASGGIGSTISSSRLQCACGLGTLTNSFPRTIRWSFLLFVATLPMESLSLPYISGHFESAKTLRRVFFPIVFVARRVAL